MNAIQAQKELEKNKEEFSRDEINEEILEAYVEFWDKVAECEFCPHYEGRILCSSHYSLFFAQF